VPPPPPPTPRVLRHSVLFRGSILPRQKADSVSGPWGGPAGSGRRPKKNLGFRQGGRAWAGAGGGTWGEFRSGTGPCPAAAGTKTNRGRKRQFSVPARGKKAGPQIRGKGFSAGGTVRNGIHGRRFLLVSRRGPSKGSVVDETAPARPKNPHGLRRHPGGNGLGGARQASGKKKPRLQALARTEKKTVGSISGVFILSSAGWPDGRWQAGSGTGAKALRGGGGLPACRASKQGRVGASASSAGGAGVGRHQRGFFDRPHPGAGPFRGIGPASQQPPLAKGKNRARSIRPPARLIRHQSEGRFPRDWAPKPPRFQGP